MRATAVLTFLGLISGYAFLVAGFVRLHFMLKRHRVDRHRLFGVVRALFFGSALIVSVYGFVPAAEIFVYASVVLAIATAGLVAGVDLVGDRKAQAVWRRRLGRKSPDTPAHRS